MLELVGLDFVGLDLVGLEFVWMMRAIAPGW